jgi:hypothetical protein
MKRYLKYLILLIIPLALLLDGSGVAAVSSGIEAVQHVLPIIDIANYTPMADGNITYQELVDEVSKDTQYTKLKTNEWDLRITSRGISHIDDTLLDEYVKKVPADMTETYKQLQELYDKNPTVSQITQINTLLAKYEAQKAPLSADLKATKDAVKADDKTVKLTEEAKAIIQEKANAVAAIDGKISEVIAPLRIPSGIAECERWIGSVKDKFALAVKEQELRSKGLVKREYFHSIYYMDFNASTGAFTGVATFTNGSKNVTGVGTNFTAAVAATSYVRVSTVGGGTEWYRINTITSDTAMALVINFAQANVADGSGATLYSNVATNDGSTIAKAFCHLNQFTTDTTRTAGDILKVRANQTNVVAGTDIAFDEDGTVTNYDEIRGCSVVDDPFGDASNVQPIFDFGNTAYKVTLSADDYWRLYNIEVTNNNSSSGLITIGVDLGIVLDTVTLHGANNAAGGGITLTSTSSRGVVQHSILYSNISNNIYVGGGYLFINACILNGGLATTDYGIWNAATSSSIFALSCSTLGLTTTHDVSSLYIGAGKIIYGANNSLADFTQVTFSSTNSLTAFLDEDNSQVLGTQAAWYCSGTVTKSSTVLRTGGGTSSAYLLPSSVVTIKYPLNIAYGSLNPDFAIWCPASPVTVTVYMRTNSHWLNGQYPDDQIIANGNMETSDPPTGWTLAGAGATWSRSNTQAKYGTYSGKLIRGGTDCYSYQQFVNDSRFNGTNFTYGCWVYATAANRARIAINDGTTTTYSSYHTGSSSWEWLSVTASVAANLHIVQVRNYVDTGDTTAYFDWAYAAPPLHQQLTLTADYYDGVGTAAHRATSTASAQHLWDNNEPARNTDGTAATYAADAGTDTTHVVDSQLTGGTNDYYNGWYLWNTTRSLGAEVTDYDSGTKTLTLGSAIASQTTADTYFLLNWVAFTTTFTPSTAGFAYVKINLGLYYAGKGIYVDAKPLGAY